MRPRSLPPVLLWRWPVKPWSLMAGLLAVGLVVNVPKGS